MRFTITHRGVPIGTGELESEGDLGMGDVDPLPGYAAIAPVVRAASTAMDALGLLGRAGAVQSPAEREAAFGRAAALGRELELRDVTGAYLPADSIELMEFSEAGPLAVFVYFGRDPAGVLARLRPRGRREGGSAFPEA